MVKSFNNIYEMAKNRRIDMRLAAYMVGVRKWLKLRVLEAGYKLMICIKIKISYDKIEIFIRK